MLSRRSIVLTSLLVVAAGLICGAVRWIGRPTIVYEKVMEDGVRVSVREIRWPRMSYWKEWGREKVGDKNAYTKERDPYVKHFELRLADSRSGAYRLLWGHTVDCALTLFDHLHVLDVTVSRRSVAMLFYDPNGLGCVVVDRHDGRILFHKQQFVGCGPDAKFVGVFEENTLVAKCDDSLSVYSIRIVPSNESLLHELPWMRGWSQPSEQTTAAR